MRLEVRIHSRKRSWHDGASRRGTRSKSAGELGSQLFFPNSTRGARGGSARGGMWLCDWATFLTYCGVSTNSQRMPCPEPSPMNRSRRAGGPIGSRPRDRGLIVPAMGPYS